MSEEQLAFGIEGMLHEAAVEPTPEWRGAPLHFTMAYYPPAELDAALDHWMFVTLRRGLNREGVASRGCDSDASGDASSCRSYQAAG